MDSKRFTRRLVALGAAMFFCALVFVVTLFDAQIVNGDDYLAQSIRTNAKSETVKFTRRHHRPQRQGTRVEPRGLHAEF